MDFSSVVASFESLTFFTFSPFMFLFDYSWFNTLVFEYIILSIGVSLLLSSVYANLPGVVIVDENLNFFDLGVWILNLDYLL